MSGTRSGHRNWLQYDHIYLQVGKDGILGVSRPCPLPMPSTELSPPGALEMLLLRAKRSKGLKRPSKLLGLTAVISWA